MRELFCFVSCAFHRFAGGHDADMAAQYPQPGPDRVYAIKAGKLVDPEKGTTETNQIILVRGKKIEAVGANLSDSRGCKSHRPHRNRRSSPACSTRTRISA